MVITKYIKYLGIKLNSNQISKFLTVDSELDVREKPEIGPNLITFNYIKKKVDTSKKISKFRFW